MYPVIRAKNRKDHMMQEEAVLHKTDRMEYLTFPQLTEIGCIRHAFSTRIGGVSKGEFAGLNFSFTRGDDASHVRENYARMAKIFETDESHFVTTDQTHTTNIRIVTAEDAGKGVTGPRDYSDIDGLITKEKGLILSCFFADCVPLYFVDPQKEVIGLAHSGWRGTAAGMGACMVEKMKEAFGCDPKEIRVAVGPSICQDCYEISKEVALQFTEGFWGLDTTRNYGKEAYRKGGYPSDSWLKEGRREGHYQLDLWLANLLILRSAGILLENISMTDICTACNPSYLFSHRATGGKRGNLGAFLMLCENKSVFDGGMIMNEKEKMHSGDIYDPGKEEIMKEQSLCLDRLYDFNLTRPTEGEKRSKMLQEMFAQVGEGCYIEPPFHANWGGKHVHFGKYVYANFNLTLVDDTHIYVGDYTMFGPNVTVATAGHPILPKLRKKGMQYNMPVYIGKNCWIGAGALILPGVTIGDNTVIGAGSVVTKDIPADVVAVGNPCKVLRKIGEHDREYYFKDRRINMADL